MKNASMNGLRMRENVSIIEHENKSFRDSHLHIKSHNITTLVITLQRLHITFTPYHPPVESNKTGTGLTHPAFHGPHKRRPRCLCAVWIYSPAGWSGQICSVSQLSWMMMTTTSNALSVVPVTSHGSNSMSTLPFSIATTSNDGCC